MRIRERTYPSTVYSGVIRTEQDPWGGPITTITGTYVADGSYERICDQAGPKGNKPCLHVKNEVKVMPLNGFISYDFKLCRNQGTRGFSWTSAPALPVVSPAHYEQAMTSFVGMFSNQPEPVLDLGETVAEMLTAIPRLGKAVSRQLERQRKWKDWLAFNDLSAWQTYADFGKLTVSRMEKVYDKTLRRLDSAFDNAPREVATAYVAWKFGIQPILDLLNGASDSYDRLISTLERLRDQNGKWVRHGLSRTPVSIPAAVHPINSYGHAVHVVGLGGEATIKLSCEVRTNFHELNEIISELRGERRRTWKTFKALAYGYGFRPIVAWQVLPWSFAVDWFFRIEDKLQPLSTTLVPGTYEVRKPCTSTTRSIRFWLRYGHNTPSHFQWNHGPRGTTYQNTFCTVGVGRRYEYSRSPSLPSANLDVGSLTSTQKLLTAALFAQRT